MNTYGYPENLTFYQQRMMSSPNGSSNLTDGRPTYNPSLSSSTSAATDGSRLHRSQLSPPSPLTDISINPMGDNGDENEVTGSLLGMGGNGEIVQDELSVMSQALLGQQFLELDRVITLEGTDFDFNVSNWGNLS
jgi:hypothetical protein